MITRRKLLWIAGFLVALHAAIIFAGFLAPYDPAAQNRELPFAPPTRLHIFGTDGRPHLPFIYAWKPKEGAFSEYDLDTGRTYEVRFFHHGAAYRLGGFIPCDIHLVGVNEPAQIFLFGTDEFGRDVFSRTLIGGQISLLAGLLATLTTLFFGTIIGSVAGFYGGWLDDMLMRVADLFLTLPWLYLLFAARAFLPLQMEPLQAFGVLVCVIGLVGWAKPARLVRGLFLSAKERNYVRAARGFGGSDFYIIRRHVMPEAYGVILTQAALLIPQYVMAEITLSFLGLGIGEPVATWGNMLNSLMQVHILQSYWWMIAPGLIAIPFFLGYQMLGATLEEMGAEASV